MNLKTNTLKKNKKGSYLVEAAITLPILIVSICAMILIIRIIAICETITYVTSTDLIDMMFFYDNKLSTIPLCSDLKENLKQVSDIKVTKYKHLYEDGDMNNLIALGLETNFNVFNGIGIDGNVAFTEDVLCRAFAGNEQPNNPLSEYKFTEDKKACAVFVFPKYGERYHIGGCRYIKQNISERTNVIEMDREDAFRKGYSPCIICIGAAYE